MRILLVSPYFPPRNAPGALRVYGFARAWAEAGEDVTVLTTAKLPHQRGLELPREGFQVAEIPYTIPAGLERLRHALRETTDNGTAQRHGGRVWRPLRSALRRIQQRTGIYGSVRMPDFTDRWVGPAVEWAGRQPPFDVVVSSGGPYTAHVAALRIRRLGLARLWVADHRDLWVDHHAFGGLFPFTIRERMLEQQCLRGADLAVTVSEGLAAVLRSKASTEVEIIYNGLDPQEPALLPPGPAFDADGTVRLVYTGSLHTHGQDPGPLLRVLGRVERGSPEIAARLSLVVAGPDADRWRRLAGRVGATRSVETVGEVERTTALCMQRDAAALLLLDWKRADAGVLTGKLFEYLGAEAPILVVGGRIDSPAAQLVRRCGRGVHLGRDEAAIEGTLRDLLAGRNPVPGPPDRDLIATFCRERQARRLHERIVALLRSRPPVREVRRA
jgi:glycosyltransferase involved in cell wall biosynthesis